jgi:hypothetical protein
MHTTTLLHSLLLRFRDEVGAQTCAVWSLDSGSRVDVGRPSTLTAEELMEGSSAQAELGARRLEATVPAGYAISADFDSEEAAENARAQFEELVLDVAQAVTDPES